MKNPENYVRIFDTTLRDGEQAPGFSMNVEEKIRLAVQLEKLGVDVIEAGFPAASPDDFKAVQLIAQTLKKPEICGLARAMESDIRTTWDAIKDAQKPRIHTFIGTSPTHMEFKLKKTPEQILEMTKFAVTLAKSLCDRVDFSPEDAGRSDKKFLVQVIETAIECGADVINIPDTVGYNQPEEFGALIKYLIENVKNSDQAIFSTHCHNDLGLAAANSLAGVLNGARQIECTVNGAGERAGNAALEEVVMAMKVRKDFFGLETGIETTEIFATSQLLQQLTGQKVQSNKSIVGKNAFAHESGIHQHGMLANRETYEILTPESVGVNKTELVLGKHSGRAALGAHLKEMGYALEDEKFQEIFLKFKDLADKKKDITDADLDVLVHGEANHEMEKWELISYSVSSGTSENAVAKVCLKNKETGEEKSSEKTGTGMVDASFQCIREILEISDTTLTHFGIDAVTDGIDAQAVVNLRVEDSKGQNFSGKSGDTDIVKASIEAYICALG